MALSQPNSNSNGNAINLIGIGLPATLATLGTFYFLIRQRRHKATPQDASHELDNMSNQPRPQSLPGQHDGLYDPQPAAIHDTSSPIQNNAAILGVSS